MEWLGVRECVAVSSWTCGLALTLRALDLTGEVILPSFNFFASAHAVLWNGLEPVFADCEPDSFNLNPEHVARLIGPATSAILTVHMFGNPADTEALEAIARRHGVRLIFDAAHALGSRRDGRRVGGFGDAEVFSLSPTKLLVAGEGGLIATQDRELAARLRAARNYGDAGGYDPIVLGLNARLPEFNALLALGGLPEVESRVARRNGIAARFVAGLADLPGLAFQHVRPSDTSPYKDFAVLVESEEFGLNRDELAQALAAENVEVRKYFHPPLHEQRLCRAFYDPDRESLRATEQIARRVLSLPIYSSLTDGEVDRLVTAVAKIHDHRAEIGQALRQLLAIAVAAGN
ncbi:MAG: DegT/DnrJ/EryC1/StrS family aminotransferase [Steroidobacteraceae bacterium]